MEELTNAPTAERSQLYEALPDGRPGWARLLRMASGAIAPPTEEGLKRALPYKEADICEDIKNQKTPQGVGKLLRPRQEAANLFSEALRAGGKACPPYVPFLSPKFEDAPRALQDPDRKRAADARKDRQRRNGAQTSYWIPDSSPCPTCATL